jgi:hypothetical protein
MQVSKHPAYNCWKKMRDRCNNPNNCNFKYYGGVGVRVCERWDDFEAFIADIGPRPTAQHSIDRKDSSGNYEPGNCRWATTAEQNRNKRTVQRLKVGGAELISTHIAEIIGVHRTYVTKMARSGLTLDGILAKFGYEVVPISALRLSKSG